MGGFLLGSLLLVGLSALLQQRAASQAKGAATVAVGLLQRVLSPEVAGIPNKAKTSTGGSGKLPDPLNALGQVLPPSIYNLLPGAGIGQAVGASAAQIAQALALEQQINAQNAAAPPQGGTPGKVYPK